MKEGESITIVNKSDSPIVITLPAIRIRQKDEDDEFNYILEELKFMVNLSDQWGKEWFDVHTWRWIENIKGVLNHTKNR